MWVINSQLLLTYPLGFTLTVTFWNGTSLSPSGLYYACFTHPKAFFVTLLLGFLPSGWPCPMRLACFIVQCYFLFADGLLLWSGTQEAVFEWISLRAWAIFPFSFPTQLRKGCVMWMSLTTGSQCHSGRDQTYRLSQPRAWDDIQNSWCHSNGKHFNFFFYCYFLFFMGQFVLFSLNTNIQNAKLGVTEVTPPKWQ